MSYLLKYDSIYGPVNNKIEAEDDKIRIDDNDPISIYHKEAICDVSWEKHDVDIVIDASGISENLKLAREIKARGIKNWS